MLINGNGNIHENTKAIMPVYVTGAHVTLGESGRRSHLKNYGTLKRPFYFKDTFKTPYCCRTVLVIFSGLILVGSGTVMTITGYKPAILLPWYSAGFNFTTRNESYKNSVSDVLGEPGPLRIMIYTGPVLMGIGFFGVMMAVVLFCEIKDRYLMKILPIKRQANKIQKDMLYDIIISEFRKNYFRGIEVPIRKEDRKKNFSKRWSFSLSGSGSSFISFARRHSHDLFKIGKRKQKGNEKIARSKWKNATFPKHATSDSWMKTSSLPNIKHKSEIMELDILPPVESTIDGSHVCDHGRAIDTKVLEKSNEPNITGVDNLAYRDSPSNKKIKQQISANRSNTLTENITLTTVVIHNISKHNECAPCHLYNSYQDKTVNNDSSKLFIRDRFKDSFVDITKDAEESLVANHHLSKHKDHNVCLSNDDHEESEIANSVDALEMASDTSSLTMSWEGPLEWSDARRNTEPCNLFKPKLDSSSNDSVEDMHQTSTQKVTTKTREATTVTRPENTRKSCTYKTVIRVFHSESSLSKPYTFLKQTQHDAISLDSLELTDEMLKNFDLNEIAHI